MKKLIKFLMIVQFGFLIIFSYVGINYYKMNEENKRLIKLKNEYDNLVSEMKTYSELKNSYLVVIDEGKKLEDSSVTLKNKISSLEKDINSIKVKINDINKKIDDIS